MFTPVDIMAGRCLSGRVVVYDDDHYYMGGVMAEFLAERGCEVTLVTPAPFVSDWSRNTLEQRAIHVRLNKAGVEIVLNRGVMAIYAGEVETNDTPCAQTSGDAVKPRL